MSFVNSKCKNVYWWNKNYFWLGTILVVGINILLFGLWGNEWCIWPKETSWENVLDFYNILSSFLSAFAHANWQHCLLNMLTFSVMSIYLERKIGTFNLILLVIVFAFLGESAVSANHFYGFSIGFSGVVYSFNAYCIIDYFFSLTKSKRNLANIIYGAIVLVYIYVSMCFNGGVHGFGFEVYPYDLLTNMGHYTAFLVGIVVTLGIKLCKFIGKKEHELY